MMIRCMSGNEEDRVMIWSDKKRQRCLFLRIPLLCVSMTEIAVSSTDFTVITIMRDTKINAFSIDYNGYMWYIISVNSSGRQV